MTSWNRRRVVGAAIWGGLVAGIGFGWLGQGCEVCAPALQEIPAGRYDVVENTLPPELRGTGLGVEVTHDAVRIEYDSGEGQVTVWYRVKDSR